MEHELWSKEYFKTELQKHQDSMYPVYVGMVGAIIASDYSPAKKVGYLKKMDATLLELEDLF